jgi:hypothetical protein
MASTAMTELASDKREPVQSGTMNVAANSPQPGGPEPAGPYPDGLNPGDPNPGGIDTLPLLLASIERHQQHLITLINSYRQAGVYERQIDAALCGLMESYKEELLVAIRAMMPTHNQSGYR